MFGKQAESASVLKCGRFDLDLTRPRIMAVINITPDSFSGDGLAGRMDQAMARVEAAIESGADILDIGGESSRPGATPVSVQEEMDRVLPLVERLARGQVPVSIDTVKPAVMVAAIRAGASMINDISGFRSAEAVAAVSRSDVGLCVMHMQGSPETMQDAPAYGDVIADVTRWLNTTLARLNESGVAAQRIALDPGFGFGKTLEHNLALFRGLPQLLELGYPLLVGVSRKSMLGAITGQPVEQRMVASVCAAMLAAQAGARILRVHDVSETRDALKVLQSVTEFTTI